MLNLSLNPQTEKLLRRERSLLSQAEVQLARQGLSTDSLVPLRQAIEQLDELFLVMVVGEFNAGKSAVINRLLGEPLLAEGVTPTTRSVHLIKWGEPSREQKSGAFEIITAQAPILEHVSIVDTPGTNAIDREHERLTREFVPRADVILFVTSADRPFSESERRFLEQVRDWGKKIVFAINKVDLLRTPSELEEVRVFVKQNVHDLLASEAPLFLVSARSMSPETDEFETLEDYIQSTLDELQRIRLKMLNPIGVAAKLMDDQAQQLTSDFDLLQEDHQTLLDIETQLGTYKDDMGREFGFRLSDVENQLHDLEHRGIDFFDRRMRLFRILGLLDRDRLKADFEREVVGDLSSEIDAKVGRLIDWMLDSDRRQWESIYSRLKKRPTASSERLVGEVSHSLHLDRQQLVDRFGNESRKAVEDYDRGKEASQMADSVARAVAGTALAEVGAVGLGTAVTIIATSTAVDVTGLLAAGTLATLGLFAIPHRRRKAKLELRQKIGLIRERLMGAMRTRFQQAQEDAAGRIQTAMGPYSRFVRTERAKLDTARQELEEIRDSLKALETELRGMQ